MNCPSLFAALAAALFTAAAGAEVLTFDELAHDDPYRFVNPVASGGFLFRADCGTGRCLAVWGRDSGHQADPGEAAVFVNVPGTSVAMSKIGGGGFDLHSIDLADVYDDGAAMTVKFTFHYKASAPETDVVTLDHHKGPQTFVFDRAGLDRVEWAATDGDDGTLGTQFDNVDISAVHAVPEPSSSALLLAGMGVLGAMAGRRQLLLNRLQGLRCARASTPPRHRR